MTRNHEEKANSEYPSGIAQSHHLPRRVHILLRGLIALLAYSEKKRTATP